MDYNILKSDQASFKAQAALHNAILLLQQRKLREAGEIILDAHEHAAQAQGFWEAHVGIRKEGLNRIAGKRR